MIHDELIYAATQEYEVALLETFPDLDTYYHKYSLAFRRKISWIIWRVNHTSSYRFLQRIACAIIVIFLCGSLFLFLNNDVRAAVVDWVKEQFAYFTGYFFEGETSYNPCKEYAIEWLPEEYSLLDQIDLPDGKAAVYINSYG